MNPTYKRPWIEALRSGNYSQGRERLKRVNSEGVTFHCCLGVLREVASKPWGELACDGSFRNPSDGDARVGTLSTAELSEFDLTSQQHRDLYGMNDGGKSFAEIADYIESYL